jgi:Arc/MetJ-type ribon-helix-helix transcriptional regulator
MRKNQTINMTLSGELLKAVDKQAEMEIRNRSELIREAIRMYLIGKNANEIHQTFTTDESNRINEIINFSDFKDFTTLSLSCSYRPQPNQVKEIFAGNESPLVKYIENPTPFRNMGWDLLTLGRAKPVAGEYLQITNGDRKIIKVYRDGQVIFGASEDFFGHGMETEVSEIEKTFKFNCMATAELISNFVNFSLEITKYLGKSPSGLIYKIRIFNPKRKRLELVSINTFRNKLGELPLDLADREIYIPLDGQSPEKIAYLIWAEFNYLFGISEDQFWYTKRETKEMDFNVFINQK